MLFYIQLAAIVSALLAFAWFGRSNLAVMRFRKFSKAGLIQLWTGNIDTRQLITPNAQAPGKIEKELVKAVITYKQSRAILYTALILNLVIFLLHSFI